MTATSDNIAYHPASPEARAIQAMAVYKAGVTDLTTGKGKAIHAVIEYGKALLEGRKSYPSNKIFGPWVVKNKLDVGDPWQDRRERTAAIKIAEISIDGTVPSIAFNACPNARPTHIMKWYRAQQKPKKPKKERVKKPKDDDLKYHHRIDEIIPLFDKGMTDKQIAVELGIGDGSGRGVRHITERIRIERKAIAKYASLEAKVLGNAEANFSEKSKLTLADAIRIHKSKLDKTFQIKLGEEVRRRIVEADDSTRKENVKLRKDNFAITLLLRQKTIFTPDEYKTILKCLHPDNSASSGVRAQAFDLFKQKEKRLVGQL